MDNAQAAGVSASLNVGEGLIHVWPVFPMPEAAESLSQIGAFIDKHLP